MDGILGAFPKGLQFEIKTLTAEEDRVAIEVESRGMHVSGRPYHNEYHFLMRIRDGRIVEFKEYLDTLHANEVLLGG
jgi:ketosteroid isomerase-like protein